MFSIAIHQNQEFKREGKIPFHPLGILEKVTVADLATKSCAGKTFPSFDVEDVQTVSSTIVPPFLSRCSKSSNLIKLG